MKKLFLIPLLCLSFVQAKTIQCQVIQIHDGNTISCSTKHNEPLKIQLLQISAPTLAQDYAYEAKLALSNMLLNRDVMIETIKQDQDKKTLGIVLFDAYKCPQQKQKCANDRPNSCEEETCYRNANIEMIQLGYARYTPFGKVRPEYSNTEQEAQEAKRGLWADKKEQGKVKK